MSKPLRLYINVDHVATLREVRRAVYPDPVRAAVLCEAAGADGITAHLREDRRHIQDHDIERLTSAIRTVLNLEMACTDEMLRIAERVRPYQVTLVPERREEVTTEGGLDVARDPAELRAAIDRIRAAGSRASLFIDADLRTVEASKELGADAIELHTGPYSHSRDSAVPLAALKAAAQRGVGLGLAVHAGHGLTVENVGPVAAVPEIEELNIGHAIVAQAVYIGIAAAVKEMRVAMAAGRGVGQALRGG
ncbi:MAG TPA: pyridoxine 5'-phosphate synthase [Gemmatimonadaceae bacterium]|jgi:pyridoxine 5-phosphate synthase